MHRRQVEARGNALEKLQAENDALTDDYNGLRARFAASEAEAIAKVMELEGRLAAARADAAAAPAAAAPPQRDSGAPPVGCAFADLLLCIVGL